MVEALSDDPAGWIAFEVLAGSSPFWLSTGNLTEDILNSHWNYDWDTDQSDVGPTTANFSAIKSVSSKVVRDYAGINSSGGPQVSGRADHGDIVVERNSDGITPILYQFVSTGEAFNRILIVLPEYGGGARVEWMLRGVNLTNFEFTGTRTNSTSQVYVANSNKIVDSSEFAGRTTGRFYLRYERIGLLYTSAEVRVGTGTVLTQPVEFRGWDTGSNDRIGDYPTNVASSAAPSSSTTA